MKLSKLTLFLTILVATAATAQVSIMGVPDRDPATPNLDTIKKLVGDWVELDEAGSPTDNVVSSYRVTAGGSAVLDIEFGGTDHEMLTVYYQDGDELVLTHYCVLGNQPHMRAEPGTGPDKLVFNCEGGTNLSCALDKHMHRGEITLLDEDHLTSKWYLYEKGDHVYTAEFKLVRRKGPQGNAVR
jgi:hypothetical protein